jgi:lipid-binding SYLF domain-containing protein
MNKTLRMILLMSVVMVPMTACADVNMKPRTPSEWQDYLRYRRNQTLDELYKLQPQARWEIMNAKGYATFTSLNVNLIFASVTSGRGIVHENGFIGKDTFMRMAQGGLGLGFGVKDFRAVFVFDNKEVLNKFINSGWSFGTEADAAFKGGDTGAAISGAIAIAPGLRVYQLTQSGLALQATVHGTKYWRDAFVNGNSSAE